MTEYIDRLNKAEKFQEANDDKACKFYSYQRVVESHTGKECKPEGYQRTACVYDTKPVKHHVSLIKGGGLNTKNIEAMSKTARLFFQ